MPESGLLAWLTMIGEWGIVFTILYEGRIALKEFRSTRIFEAIQYIEADDTRSARKTLYEGLHRDTPSQNWWETDKNLDHAAAITCARYNLLGVLTRRDKYLRQFVVREWTNNICWTHEALQEYIRYRERSKTGRPRMFRHYEELYADANQHLESEKLTGT